MAGRYGSSGGAASTMIVTNTPAKDLAYTNCAYCSPTDLRNFLVPGSKFAYALVADAFVLTIAYPFKFRSLLFLVFIMRLQIYSVSVLIIGEISPLIANEQIPISLRSLRSLVCKVPISYLHSYCCILMIKDNALWYFLNCGTLPTMVLLMVNLVLMRFKDVMPKFPLETLYPLAGLAGLSVIIAYCYHP